MSHLSTRYSPALKIVSSRNLTRLILLMVRATADSNRKPPHLYSQLEVPAAVVVVVDVHRSVPATNTTNTANTARRKADKRLAGRFPSAPGAPPTHDTGI